MAKNYSLLERKLASFFRKFPFIKKAIKSKYQYLNYLLYKTNKKIISNEEVFKVQFKDCETFFGYYDKSPLNISESKILFQATNYPTKKLPNINESIKVIVKDFLSDKILYEDDTTTYNWQQGSKLQWLDNVSFIYNIYNNSNKEYNSKIVNLETKEERIIKYPIYDTTKNYALTLNFDTLNKLRPDYGYRQGDNRFSNLGYKSDGIFKIDIKTGDFSLLLSIEDCMKLQSKLSMNKAKHKFNHIMISPDGDKFIFLHRWFQNGRKFDRLLLYDLKTKKVSLLLDDEMVSHCFWKNNNQIITFANTKEHGDCYYEVNTITRKVHRLEFKGSNSLGDGHPNIFNNSKMVIDTYPDRSRMKGLYFVDLVDNSIKKIASLFEDFKFKGESRCDLHPRWSPKGNYIFFDSVHEENQRGLFYIKTNNLNE